MSTFTLPIKVNANVRGHTRFLGKKVKKHRYAAKLAARAAWRKVADRDEEATLDAGLVVTLTRVAPCELDSHDNLRTALKPMVDGITDALGLKSDRDPRVSWNYAQEAAGVREYGVKVELSARPVMMFCPTCGSLTVSNTGAA